MYIQNPHYFITPQKNYLSFCTLLDYKHVPSLADGGCCLGVLLLLHLCLSVKSMVPEDNI